MAESKYSVQIVTMKELKAKMKPFYNEQSDEEQQQQQQQAPSQWETIYCSIHSVMEQLKIHNLKAQQVQHTEPWSENDMVNLMRILELAYSCLKDCGYIKHHENVDDTMNGCSPTSQQPVFGEQMAKLKQQIDLVSFEITKLRTVKEALDNIYSTYNMELAVSSSDQDNEEDNDIFI